MRVHAIKTGRLVGNEAVMRANGPTSLFRRRRPYEFPIHCFVVEHPEGPIAIDTGLTARVRVPALQRLMSARIPLPEPAKELVPQVRATGLDPTDVRRVVLTHLDWDHAGGLEHFPDAAAETSRRMHRLVSEVPTVFIPSHDADGPARLAAMKPLDLGGGDRR